MASIANNIAIILRPASQFKYYTLRIRWKKIRRINLLIAISLEFAFG